MFNFDDVALESIVVHNVGNRQKEERVVFSKEVLQINDETQKELLLSYFLSAFKINAFYSFTHDENISMNEVYNYANSIFADNSSFYQQSVNIAKYLFEKSNHPKINGGELYVTHFKDCVVDDEVVDAIGLFKSENKDTFLRINQSDNVFKLDFEDGVNTKKLDKGCLIFNTEKEAGYKVAIVDNVNKSKEAQYWRDEFLKVVPREDNYYQTKNYMQMCKGFVDDVFNDDNKVEKADQIDMLNKSANFFKDNEQFNSKEFEEEVLGAPDVVDAFKDYKQNYKEVRDVNVADEFEISEDAFKGEKRHFKSILKLDKNFHIYIHGDRNLIEKGYDEGRGLNFYRVFYNDEK